MPLRRTLLLAAFARPSVAQDATLRILSAGAVEPGMRAALALYPAPTAIAFATAPQLRARIGGGETPDVLVAPPALLVELAARLGEPRVPLGRVGVGIAIRNGAPDPAIADAASLRAALLAADSIVMNRASTGLYLEALFARLGIADAIAARITRYPDGASVMAHIARGTAAREIGFAPMTEIILARRDHPLRLVGPLPPHVQNHTAYAAAPLGDATHPDAARAFLAWLAGPQARAAFDEAGIEP